jgi:UDP-2,3-diacylglucosamine pyrophosphatase LpxH
MELCGTDLHIHNKSCNRQAQHAFITLAEQPHYTGVRFLGDTWDRSIGEADTLNDELTERLRNLAKQKPVTCIAGNFPHDDLDWLMSKAAFLAPIKIVPEIWDSRYRQLFTHGAQFDPTIAFWNHFKFVQRFLPELIKTFLIRTPSSLAAQGDYSALVKFTGPIHQRAQRAAIDGHMTVFMGHTHLRQHLSADPVHEGKVEVLGSLGSGPYTYMNWDAGDYEILNLEGC